MEIQLNENINCFKQLNKIAREWTCKIKIEKKQTRDNQKRL